MKKSYLLLLVLISSLSLIAQDVIKKTNGEQLQVKVLEITEYAVKYAESDNPDGAIKSVRLNKVASVVYANGTEEVINGPASGSPDEKSGDGSKSEPVLSQNSNPTYETTTGGSYRTHKKFQVGIGSGAQYAGANLGLSNKVVFYDAVAIRLGYALIIEDFETVFVVNLGTQFYLGKYIYTDISFGFFGNYELGFGEAGYIDDYFLGPAGLLGVKYDFTKNFGAEIGVGAGFDFFWEEFEPAASFGIYFTL